MMSPQDVPILCSHSKWGSCLIYHWESGKHSETSAVSTMFVHPRDGLARVKGEPARAMVSLPADVSEDFDTDLAEMAMPDDLPIDLGISIPEAVDEDAYWELDAATDLQSLILPEDVLLPEDVEMEECHREECDQVQPRVHLEGRDAVMEVFCPPRLVPVAKSLGLKASVSLDVTHGWDANRKEDRDQAVLLLKKKKPWLLLVCPECRMFSILQRNCNIPKMDPEQVKQMMVVAVAHVDFSMEMLKEQALLGGKFIFEHPAGASSWSLRSVKDVLDTVPGSIVVSFPQCAYGLCNPETGEPWRKNTKFLTNSRAVAAEFGNAKCQCTVPHDTIQGNLRGEKKSRLAQIYPPKLVHAMVQCSMKGN